MKEGAVEPMAKRRNMPTEEARRKAQANLHRDIAQRQAGYRARALKLLPHICASCGREFDGKRLKELTVHHKDHDHTHNPPDGSNWELLCIYCHDHEHEKTIDAKYMSAGDAPAPAEASRIANPFADLDIPLKPDA